MKQSCRNCNWRAGSICTKWGSTFKSEELIDTFDASNCIYWFEKWEDTSKENITIGVDMGSGDDYGVVIIKQKKADGESQ